MADQVSSAVGQFTGAFSGFSFAGIGNSITIIVLLVLLAAITFTIGYFIIMNKRYNKTILIYEDIAGRGYVPNGKDKAMIVKVGDGGEEVLYLRKRKVYRTAYGKKVGTNTYAFAIGSDGYWYNITFGNLNKELKELKVEPIDRDMRYMHVAIRRNIANRYDQKSWLKENIGLIVGIVSILLVLIFLWLMADKYFTIFSAADKTIQSAGQLMDKSDAILSHINNICSTGSANGGLVPGK